MDKYFKTLKYKKFDRYTEIEEIFNYTEKIQNSFII